MSETQVVEQPGVEKFEEVKKEMTDSGIQESNNNYEASKSPETPPPNGHIPQDQPQVQVNGHDKSHKQAITEDFEHVGKSDEGGFDKDFENTVHELGEQLDNKVEQYLDELDQQEQKVLEVIDNVLKKHSSVEEAEKAQPELHVEQVDVSAVAAEENGNVKAEIQVEGEDIDRRVHVQVSEDVVQGQAVNQHPDNDATKENSGNVQDGSNTPDSVDFQDATDSTPPLGDIEVPVDAQSGDLVAADSQSSLPLPDLDDSPADDSLAQVSQPSEDAADNKSIQDNIEETFEKVQINPLTSEYSGDQVEITVTPVEADVNSERPVEANDSIEVTEENVEEVPHGGEVEAVFIHKGDHERQASVESTSFVFEATEAAARLISASSSESLAKDPPEEPVANPEAVSDVPSTPDVAAQEEAKDPNISQVEVPDVPSEAVASSEVVVDNIEEAFEKVEVTPLSETPLILERQGSSDTLLDSEQPAEVHNPETAQNVYENVAKLESVEKEVPKEEEKEEKSVKKSIFKVITNLIDRHLVEHAEPEHLDRYKRYEQMAAESSYPIPYRSKLTEPFEPGQTLIVKGKTVEDSVRFTVSLHTATADFSGNDVPLHISVRFDEGKIVFNTFSKGEWGKEERKGNPFKKGDDIDIRVRAHDNRFTITANQKEIKEYEHRIPLSSVTHFSIDGDVFINHISWSGKYYPVPYESGIPGDGLTPGKTLLIYGTPEKKGKRFHINLLKKNGDIALHFNPRFDEKAIVRNSLINNEWGNEEREGKNPLEKDVGFDLKIVNEEYAFQIFINEERFCTYAHRLEPHDLNGLQIGGDVEITGIQIF